MIISCMARIFSTVDYFELLVKIDRVIWVAMTLLYCFLRSGFSTEIFSNLYVSIHIDILDALRVVFSIHFCIEVVRIRIVPPHEDLDMVMHICNGSIAHTVLVTAYCHCTYLTNLG